MANHINAIRKVVAGIEVKTGHLYGLYLNFDKITEIISDALNSVQPDHDGNIVYHYKSRVKVTTPFRTLIIPQAHYVPNRWFYVTDLGHGSMGLEVFRYENYHRFDEQPDLRKDKKSGVMYEIEVPKDWKQR